ncbi:MAG TPA: MFS transporter [Acidimicrobiales bacterium]|nr:MFS transporter [Acidimicrobiales bacterium]
MAEAPERSLLQNRNFVLLWSGQTVSEVGSAVTQLAIPLLAVITLDATTFEVGALAACTQLAFLLIALPAGAWVDRWRRRPVLIWADIGRMAVIGSIPIADALGVLTLAQLFVVAVVAGTLTVFFDVAYQSYLPVLVEPEELVDANGKLGASQAFGQVAGPSFGGALVGALGAGYAVMIDAFSFLVSAVTTIGIRTHEPRPHPRRPDLRLRDEIKEGLAFVFGHPILRKVVGCTATSNFFGAASFAVITVYMVRTLDAPTWAIGLVFSVGSIGGLIGGLLAGRIGKVVGTARIIWLSQVVAGPFGLLAVIAYPRWGLTFVAIAFLATSVGSVVYNTAQVSYRQSICPPALLGRMNASVRFVVWGTMPLGALFGGVFGSLVGVRQTVLVGALGVWGASLWVVFSPLLHMRDLPSLDEEASAHALAAG